MSHADTIYLISSIRYIISYSSYHSPPTQAPRRSDELCLLNIADTYYCFYLL
nr:MAG TPA: hypothetical protein [Crassvirales sp.]